MNALQGTHPISERTVHSKSILSPPRVSQLHLDHWLYFEDFASWLFALHDLDDATSPNRCVFVQECSECPCYSRCNERSNDKKKSCQTELLLVCKLMLIFPKNVCNHCHCNRCNPRHMLLPLHTKVMPLRCSRT